MVWFEWHRLFVVAEISQLVHECFDVYLFTAIKLDIKSTLRSLRHATGSMKVVPIHSEITNWNVIVLLNWAKRHFLCCLWFNYLQWRSSYTYHPGNIRNMSNLHTKYVCNMACTFDELLGTVFLLSIVSTHNTVWGHLAWNTVDCPIEFLLNTHLHLVHMFLSYSNIFPYFLSDLNIHNIQGQYLKIQFTLHLIVFSINKQTMHRNA